jgi:hypothetical protein
MGVRAYRATLVNGPVGRVWSVDVGNDEVTDYGDDRLPPPPVDAASNSRGWSAQCWEDE